MDAKLDQRRLLLRFAIQSHISFVEEAHLELLGTYLHLSLKLAQSVDVLPERPDYHVSLMPDRLKYRRAMGSALWKSSGIGPHMGPLGMARSLKASRCTSLGLLAFASAA